MLAVYTDQPLLKCYTESNSAQFALPSYLLLDNYSDLYNPQSPSKSFDKMRFHQFSLLQASQWKMLSVLTNSM